MITVAPAVNSCLAVSFPMPVLAPVIMMTLFRAVLSREGLGPVMYIFLVRTMSMMDATGNMTDGTRNAWSWRELKVEVVFISLEATNIAVATTKMVRRREMEDMWNVHGHSCQPARKHCTDMEYRNDRAAGTSIRIW